MMLNSKTGPDQLLLSAFVPLWQVPHLMNTTAHLEELKRYLARREPRRRRPLIGARRAKR